MGISAIRVRQWLPEWDQVPTDETKFQSPPPREFYLTSMRASQLRALSDVHQRDASGVTSRAEDTSVQRSLEEDRTSEIRRYIHVGYPLSSMGNRKMEAEERQSLRKPGWLPTAIIANIIPAGEIRGKKMVDANDAVHIADDRDNAASIQLPKSWLTNQWRPVGAHPLEIIDGQHRLSAFDQNGNDDFEVPVVLFNGLDFSWQAYLFWTVNIKPKRINASLAYDLYPLLREQDWLEAGESLNVYRETRAQELVESLWGDTRSVWYDRINMLGQTGMKAQRPVTQAAFVRSLTTTFVRSFRGNKGFGGLFGGAANNSGLNWPRGQQSAFLIYAWKSLAEAISHNNSTEWANQLRHSKETRPETEDARTDPAFSGDESLLASDQGVRGFHMVLNDLAYLGRTELALEEWRVDEKTDIAAENQLDEALDLLSSNEVGRFLERLGTELATFDWRNSRAEFLTRSEKESKRALRGSGGYNVLRERIFEHLTASSDSLIADLAQQALDNRNG